MINRELGIAEIANRIKTVSPSLGIKTFKRTPLNPVDSYDTPFVFIYEGDDVITDYSNRSPGGYPAKRKLELPVELIVDSTDSTFNLKQLYRDLRSAILVDTTVAQNTTIYELRAEGPFGYGVPKLLGMRLVLALIYFDAGN